MYFNLHKDQETEVSRPWNLERTRKLASLVCLLSLPAIFVQIQSSSIFVTPDTKKKIRKNLFRFRENPENSASGPQSGIRTTHSLVCLIEVEETTIDYITSSADSML